MNNHSKKPIASLATAALLSLLSACEADSGPDQDEGGADPDSGAADAGAHTAALTCALIEGDNCWKDALDEIAACAPGEEQTGLLAPDRSSCSFDGAEVHFRSLPDLENDWDFTVTAAGQPCVTVVHDEQDDHDRWTLVTASGTTEYVIGDGARLGCPDGRTYETGNTLPLFDCLSDAPGDISLLAEFQVAYNLHGGRSGAVAVIDCHAEP